MYRPVQAQLSVVCRSIRPHILRRPPHLGTRVPLRTACTKPPARPRLIPRNRSLSTMSDSQPQKFTYFVYAPDYTDAEAFNRRLSVRQQHLERVVALKNEGVIRELFTSSLRPTSQSLTPRRSLQGREASSLLLKRSIRTRRR